MAVDPCVLCRGPTALLVFIGVGCQLSGKISMLKDQTEITAHARLWVRTIPSLKSYAYQLYIFRVTHINTATSAKSAGLELDISKTEWEDPGTFTSRTGHDAFRTIIPLSYVSYSCASLMSRLEQTTERKCPINARITRKGK